MAQALRLTRLSVKMAGLGGFRASLWVLVALALILGASARGGIHHSPTLRLRGGAWGGGSQQEQQMSNEVAYQEAAAPQAAPEPQPAQPTLAQHAFEYALAGSFDGLRSGVSSAVGGQIGQWCGGALARTGSVSGTAFVNVVSKIPFLKKFVVRNAHRPRDEHW